MGNIDTGELVGNILQFLYQNKWTIAVIIPFILAIIVIKIRG
ncbi:MAG: hypothetical protein N3G21_09680 [Candidatus Hydrogenedentes bacterium]|nr:hypothetical protein [Candidatus Hydrogenedentota bacterium]